MMAAPRIVSAAPIRICDLGGWTDTAVASHGTVFNIAVRPLVTVRIDIFARDTRAARVVINAENYASRYAPVLEGTNWGPHPLPEAALRASPPPDDVDIEVTIRSKAPPGASTGTSAAVAVALLAALDRLGAAGRSPQELAMLAHEVETKWLGRQSGVQDQLCSALGGVNFIEITEYPKAVVTPLRMSEGLRRGLNARLVSIYLGRAHDSSSVHVRVTRELERLGPECPQLRTLRAAAARGRDAILAADLEALGRAMRDNTDAQAALDSELVHPDAWRTIEVGAAHGAVGWKVNGAGGDGGSVTFLCGPQPGAKRAIVRAITEALPFCSPLPQIISRDGVRARDADY